MRSAVTFRGAMRPFRGLGSDGRCMFNVVHLVERRAGRQQVGGFWADVWVQHGESHARSEFAGQAADALRAEGFTVRVRPVVL